MKEQAACTELGSWLAQLLPAWEQALRFDQGDALARADRWQAALQRELPVQGQGMDATLRLLAEQVIPNGSAIPRPGCSSWITTGATHAALLARWSADLLSPQRIGLTAFNLLEDLALDWLKQMFGLPDQLQGQFTGGGASANLVGLGAARQAAYERLGWDVADQGLARPGWFFASEASHRTVHRAAAILGLGRQGVREIPCDAQGRMRPQALVKALQQIPKTHLPLAVIANAGATSTGAIDPIEAIAEVCAEFGVWLHVDGAYGLPGLLDPAYAARYRGLERADSVVVDPHKWLGAPVGTGAVFVRDAALLARSFSQGDADYFEGSFSRGDYRHSMDHPGVAYNDFGIELSAPARGVVVWALLHEIGAEGLRARVCRHNAMAAELARRVNEHPRMECLIEQSLSICCFRYLPESTQNLNEFNRQLHRALVHKGDNIPSSALIDGQFALRPCFIGARADFAQVDNLWHDTLQLAAQLDQHYEQNL